MVLRFLGRQIVSEAKDVADATADGARRLWATGQYYGREAYDYTAGQVANATSAASEYVPGIARGQSLSWQEIREKYRPQLGDTRSPEQQRREDALLRELKRDISEIKINLMAEKEDIQESIISSMRTKKLARKQAKLDVLERLSKASEINEMYRTADSGLKNENVVKGIRSRTKRLLENIVSRIKACRALNEMDEEKAAPQPSPRS